MLRARVNTCINFRGCVNCAAAPADAAARLHVPQGKKLEALTVWGSLSNAQALCTTMGVSPGMEDLLCVSLQAVLECPKAHNSVPQVCTSRLRTCTAILLLLACPAGAAALHFAPPRSGVAGSRRPFNKGPLLMEERVFCVNVLVVRRDAFGQLGSPRCKLAHDRNIYFARLSGAQPWGCSGPDCVVSAGPVAQGLCGLCHG